MKILISPAKKMRSDPDTLARLEGERARLDGLIRSVTDTIHAEERNEIMQDEQKFEVFKRQAVECNEALYGREVREKYGDAQMDEANAAVMGLTQEQYRTWTGLGEELSLIHISEPTRPY